MLLRGLVAAWPREFTSLDPLHTDYDVSEPVDRAPLTLHDRPEPPTFCAAIREVPTAKQLGQLCGTNPGPIVVMDHRRDFVFADLHERSGRGQEFVARGRSIACCPAVLQLLAAFASFLFVFKVVHEYGNRISGIHIMQEHILVSVQPRLRQAREQAGVTLAQLAERTGYAVTTLSGVENGHDQPSKRLLSRWIQTLAINESWLKTGEGEIFAKEVPKQVREQRSDLAAPIRSRIQKARQHATDLLQELDQIERHLAGSKSLPSLRKRP